MSNDLAKLTLSRAADELRRGMPLVIESQNSRWLMQPLETASEQSWSTYRTPESELVVARSAQVSRFPAAHSSYADLQIASAANIQASIPDPLTRMLIKLLKYARLLPIYIIKPITEIESEWLHLPLDIAEQALNHAAPIIEESARALLPIAGAEDAVIVSFREHLSTTEHLALIIGDLRARPPLVRLHSSCITGDILGSLRCDCGDQLAMAMHAIKADGCGILLYLHQEGRGIGITNKIRAYGLQEQGLNTYDANLHLGYEEDERDFRIAQTILEKLGIKQIRLLTNNPKKIEALKSFGIDILERLPLVSEPGEHNEQYLASKSGKGHFL